MMLKNKPLSSSVLEKFLETEFLPFHENRTFASCHSLDVKIFVAKTVLPLPELLSSAQVDAVYSKLGLLL